MKKTRGRPSKGERILLGIRFDKNYAQLVQTAIKRKGLEQGPYLQTLIAIGDKQIPDRLEEISGPTGIKFLARPKKILRGLGKTPHRQT